MMAASDLPRPDQSRPLPEHLAHLVTAKATGTLAAISSDVHRGIILADGQITAVRSSRETEKLGNFLVKKQWLEESERATALLSQSGGEALQFGEIMVDRGILTRGELDSELRELALFIIREAVTDTGAEIEFFVDHGGTDQVRLFMSPTEVLLEAARAFDSVAVMKERLGDLASEISQAADVAVRTESLQLTPTEGFILSRLGHRMSITDLIRSSSLPEDQAIGTIYTLVVAGLLTISSQPAADVSQQETPEASDRVLSPSRAQEREEILQFAQRAPRSNHYRALGLEASASTQEITDAWKEIMRRVRPERTSEPHLADAEEALEKIRTRVQNAYEVLSNPAKKRRYDQVLAKTDKSQGRQPPEADPQARLALVEANLKRAEELIRQGDNYRALQLLQMACRMDPRPRALLMLAKLEMKNPKWTHRAKENLEKALETDPYLVEGWYQLAEIWRRQNDSERQRDALERVLDLDPDHEGATKALKVAAGETSTLRRLFRRKR